MNTAFETWTFCGTRFLAAPLANGVAIMDDQCNSYGGWMSVDSFRSAQLRVSHPLHDATKQPIGKCRVAFQGAHPC